MNRRELLKSAGFWMAAPATPIIDTHVHFYDPARPQGVPWPPANDALLFRRSMPDEFRQAVRAVGVTGVVVVEASPWVEDNQWLLDLAKDEPLIVGIVGRLEPGNEEFAGSLRRFAKNRLFRGIRLGSHAIREGLSQLKWVEDLRRLSDAGLQLDAIGDNRMFGDLLQLSDRLPKLRIVIDHLPFETPAGLAEIGQRPQIYAKVSSGKMAGIDEVWKTFGPDRVIYGSNWPVSNRVAEYPAIFKGVKDYFLGKGTDASEKYFYRNPLAAYRWIKR